MKKTILYRLFGIGKIPKPLFAELQNEGIVLLDEGIKGTVTYRNFRAPGKYSNWRRQWFTTAVALTNKRLFGMRYAQRIINIPLTDERTRKMNFSLEAKDILLISSDPSLFHDGWFGTIEHRFRTAQAQGFLKMLGERITI